MTKLGLLAAAAPLLMGASPESFRQRFTYPDSLTQHSVGVWPNYYWAGRPQPVFDSPSSSEAAETADLDHSMLWIDWHEHWYVDGCSPDDRCALRDDDENGQSDLADYLERYLDVWAGKQALALNVNLVIQVHTHGISAAGPAWLHLSPEGILPTNDPRVVSAFRDFYDALYDVMKRRTYRKHFWDRAQWLVTIGNEVDLFFPEPAQWTEYTEFIEELYSNRINDNPRWLPVALTTSATYLGAVHFNRPAALELFQHTDVVTLTHYPIWFEPESPERHGHPVHRSVVAQDLDFVAGFVSEASELRGFSMSAFLQEVGYPTGTGCPVYPPGHPLVGQVVEGCDPLEEQARYVEEVFSEWGEHRDQIRGISWWSLYDYSEDECQLVWGGPQNPWCTMGLLDRDQNPKPAWDAFAAGAIGTDLW